MHIAIYNTLSGETWHMPVTKSEVRVGRVQIGLDDDDNDLQEVVLESRLVSKEHARMRKQDGAWTIEHHGTNETFLNNEALEPQTPSPLSIDDDIQVGEFHLKLVAEPDVADEDDSFRIGDLMDMENNVHTRLLELMDLRHGESTVSLDSEQTRGIVQQHLEHLVEEVFEERSGADVESVARIAMHRRVSRDLLAAGGLQLDASNLFSDLENPPFEEMIDRIQARIAKHLGLTLEPKSIEEDSRKLDVGFKDAFDHHVLEISSGLMRYLAMSFVKRNTIDLIFGLGPLQDLMDADSISEIMVISKDKIFVEKFGVVEDARRAFFSDALLLAVIERIVSPIGRRIDKSTPMVDAHLPNGSRVNAVIPPLALKGPCLTIRKFSETPLTVNDLVGFGSLTDRMARFLRACVEGHKNIVVSGGTGSGKTTLLNCISGFIPGKERIVTIEDTAELQLKQDHVVTLEARPANMEGKGAITIRDLVKNALRMRPDRIVIGECRGGEALDMLQAMNTGHDGSMTTGHANSAEDMVHRIETMVLMGTPMPISAIREQIAGAVDVIVQLNRFPSGERRVTQISEITGIDEDTGYVIVEDIFRHSHSADGATDAIHTGYIPTFTEELLTKKVAALDIFF